MDCRMQAMALPYPETMSCVLTALQTAEYPLLIHCNAGADRTGAVSAIYRMSVLGDSRERAAGELAPEYLHFAILVPCMDRLIQLFDTSPDWLTRYRQAATQPCVD
jgi:protein tyrosine/serine phosphatase